MAEAATDAVSAPASDHSHDPNAAKRRENRDRVIAALAAHGVALAVVTFDGCGDEGQIEDVSFYEADGTAISLLHTREAPPSKHGSDVPSLHTLHGQLEDFAYDALGDLHGGWEDNDGAYGEITLDVLKATVTLDHNARFTDAHNTVSEL